MYIPVIQGSGKQGRQSKKVADFILSEFKKREEVETELIDVIDYPLNATDNTEEHDPGKKWAEIAERADGFIIVSPEYNHGMPGELKMLLDSAYDQYEKKPVATVSVSGGGFGGVRMLENMMSFYFAVGLVPITESISVSRVKKTFDEDGKLLDEKLVDSAGEMFDDLLWFAKTLKAGRENQ